MASVPTFVNEETLFNVRTKSLNPLIQKVENEIEPTLTKVDSETEGALLDATLNVDTKTITFPRRGTTPDQTINLTPLLPTIPPEAYTVDVVDIPDDGGAEVSYKAIKTIKFDDNLTVAATYPPNGLGSVTISSPSPWAKVGSDPLTQVDKFAIIDPNGKAKIDAKTLTLVIPEKTPKLKGQIGNASEQEIEKVQLTGKIDTSSIMDGVLTIDLQEGGGGGGTGPGITNQNFKGFFQTLGDIESQVTDAISGKSYAFAKDSKLGGEYYTPYFYVNGKWTELKQDPALTYSGPSEALTHGVFSIKPDERISVDALGQLDLSNLGKDEYFVGFYESQEALNTAVPNPTVGKSFAFVKLNTTGAWVAQYYTHTDKGNAWLKIAPQGAMPLVEFNPDGSAKLMQNFYGVKQSSNLSVDNSGLLVINDSGTSSIKVAIKGKSGTEEGEAETLEFEAGKSYATIQDKKLILNHPQRVIQYDSTFESNHNSLDYEGNIYYDESSRCWMGWGVPSASGAVDTKWTRIAHPKMSDEVKDLNRRLPPKAPYIDPGVLGDAAGWRYTGWTYVRKDDAQLPESFRERCGAYFITIIQDVENDSERPQERYQICYADEEGATSFVRRWKRSDATGDHGWKPWVKISMSAKDISDHNVDHTSHRDSFKFYKVGTLDMSWAALKAKNSVIGDKDLLLLADSDGVSVDGSNTISVPYTGSYRFSGRIDFDGLVASGSIYPKPNFILYVYKTVNSVVSVVSEHAYSHPDHTKPVPPLQWKSGEIQLNEGDKIHFELKDFKNSLDALSGLRFIPNRNFFVMEDFRTTAGSRIAETFRRTLGSLNAHYNVGVNVHYNSGDTGPIRVYGAAVTAKATDMSKVKG